LALLPVRAARSHLLRLKLQASRPQPFAHDSILSERGMNFVLPAHDLHQVFLVVGEDASAYSGRLPATYEKVRFNNL
jgi:hypothetical protein